MNVNRTNIGWIIFGVLILIAALWGFYTAFPSPSTGATADALAMSRVVLIGLALVVMLMAVLVIVYSLLGLANATQALALPEGSVRALIAFSLVLVFVCISSFLYNSVNSVELSQGAKPLSKITEAQLNELKSQFLVAYEPARKADGSLETDTDGKGRLYNATYFTKRSKDADDFAKQIFTTLATIFVSVISFYFGSSATSAGVGAGAKAAGAVDDAKKGNDPQSALVESQTLAHEAQLAVDHATDGLAKAKLIAAHAPDSKKSVADADVAAAQKALDAAIQAARDARNQVDVIRKAVTDAAAAGGDVTKASKVLADAAKARAIAKESSENAKLSANEAERLVNKINSDAGAA